MLHGWRSGRSRALGSLPRDAAVLAFSPDGRWLAAGGDGGVIASFAVQAGATPPRFATAARHTVQTLVFDDTGRYLFAASYRDRIEVFDATSGQRMQDIDAAQVGAIEHMAVSGDGRFVATGHTSGNVLLWQRPADNGDWPHRVLLRHAAAVRGLAGRCPADGRRLLSLGADGRLMLSLPVDQGRWTLRQGDGPALPDPLKADEATSPDGRWVARAEGPRSAGLIKGMIDMGGISLVTTPRLTLLHANDRSVAVESGSAADRARRAVERDSRLHRGQLDAGAAHSPIGWCCGTSATCVRGTQHCRCRPGTTMRWLRFCPAMRKASSPYRSWRPDPQRLDGPTSRKRRAPAL